MGAAFSPTIANIYMSVIIRFLRTQTQQSLLLSRYIDDIFLVWTSTEEDLIQFLTDINTFNPALRYTHHYLPTSVYFLLDFTIYKGPLFPFTNTLDTKTFQKPHNLYQYLHYTSCHQETVYKSIIIGKPVRYVKTNTSETTYEVMKNLLKKRLLARGYPKKIVDNIVYSSIQEQDSISLKISSSTARVLSTTMQMSTSSISALKTHCSGELPHLTQYKTCSTVYYTEG